MSTSVSGVTFPSNLPKEDSSNGSSSLDVNVLANRLGNLSSLNLGETIDECRFLLYEDSLKTSYSKLKKEHVPANIFTNRSKCKNFTGFDNVISNVKEDIRILIRLFPLQPLGFTGQLIQSINSSLDRLGPLSFEDINQLINIIELKLEQLPENDPNLEKLIEKFELLKRRLCRYNELCFLEKEVGSRLFEDQYTFLGLYGRDQNCDHHANHEGSKYVGGVDSFAVKDSSGKISVFKLYSNAKSHQLNSSIMLESLELREKFNLTLSDDVDILSLCRLLGTNIQTIDPAEQGNEDEAKAVAQEKIDATTQTEPDRLREEQELELAAAAEEVVAAAYREDLATQTEQGQELAAAQKPPIHVTIQTELEKLEEKQKQQLAAAAKQALPAPAAAPRGDIAVQTERGQEQVVAVAQTSCDGTPIGSRPDTPSEFDYTQSNIGTLNQQYSDNYTQTQRSSSSFSSLSTELEQANTQSQQALEKVAEIQAEAVEAEHKAAAEEKALADLEEARKVVQAQIAAAEKEVRRLRTEEAKAKADTKKSAAQAEKEEAKQVALVEALEAQAQRQAEVAKAELDRLKGETGKVVHQLNQLRAQLQKVENEAAEAEAEKQRALEEAAKAKAKAEAIKEAETKLAKQKAATEQAVAAKAEKKRAKAEQALKMKQLQLKETAAKSLQYFWREIRRLNEIKNKKSQALVKIRNASHVYYAKNMLKRLKSERHKILIDFPKEIYSDLVGFIKNDEPSLLTLVETIQSTIQPLTKNNLKQLSTKPDFLRVLYTIDSFIRENTFVDSSEILEISQKMTELSKLLQQEYSVEEEPRNHFFSSSFTEPIKEANDVVMNSESFISKLGELQDGLSKSFKFAYSLECDNSNSKHKAKKLRNTYILSGLESPRGLKFQLLDTLACLLQQTPDEVSNNLFGKPANDDETIHFDLSRFLKIECNYFNSPFFSNELKATIFQLLFDYHNFTQIVSNLDEGKTQFKDLVSSEFKGISPNNRKNPDYWHALLKVFTNKELFIPTKDQFTDVNNLLEAFMAVGETFGGNKRVVLNGDTGSGKSQSLKLATSLYNEQERCAENAHYLYISPKEEPIPFCNNASTFSIYRTPLEPDSNNDITLKFETLDQATQQAIRAYRDNPKENPFLVIGDDVPILDKYKNIIVAFDDGQPPLPISTVKIISSTATPTTKRNYRGVNAEAANRVAKTISDSQSSDIESLKIQRLNRFFENINQDLCSINQQIKGTIFPITDRHKRFLAANGQGGWSFRELYDLFTKNLKQYNNSENFAFLKAVFQIKEKNVLRTTAFNDYFKQVFNTSFEEFITNYKEFYESIDLENYMEFQSGYEFEENFAKVKHMSVFKKAVKDATQSRIQARLDTRFSQLDVILDDNLSYFQRITNAFNNIKENKFKRIFINFDGKFIDRFYEDSDRLFRDKFVEYIQEAGFSEFYFAYYNNELKQYVYFKYSPPNNCERISSEEVKPKAECPLIMGYDSSTNAGGDFGAHSQVLHEDKDSVLQIIIPDYLSTCDESHLETIIPALSTSDYYQIFGRVRTPGLEGSFSIPTQLLIRGKSQLDNEQPKKDLRIEATKRQHELEMQFGENARLQSMIKLLFKGNDNPKFLKDPQQKKSPLLEGTVLDKIQFAASLKQVVNDPNGLFTESSDLFTILVAFSNDRFATKYPKYAQELSSLLIDKFWPEFVELLNQQLIANNLITDPLTAHSLKERNGLPSIFMIRQMAKLLFKPFEDNEIPPFTSTHLSKLEDLIKKNSHVLQNVFGEKTSPIPRTKSPRTTPPRRTPSRTSPPPRRNSPIRTPETTGKPVRVSKHRTDASISLELLSRLSAGTPSVPTSASSGRSPEASDISYI